MFGIKKEAMNIFRKLNTPGKIQDFINKIPINFEEENDGEDTCYSPMQILSKNKCHCIEAAILAALILRVHGYQPLLVDMTASKDDFDHVITVFKKHGKWGAISKSNHFTLRYREPVYETIRELVMSYFNEYYNSDGKKTLRSYSMPVDLSIFDKHGWMTSDEEVWYIPDYLVSVKHYPILNRKQIAGLRGSDNIEIHVGKIVEWAGNAKKNL